MKKDKLKIDHDGYTFGDCFGVTKERFIEIRDVVWKISKSGYDEDLKKTEIVQKIEKELNGLSLEESFLVGMTFGVLDWLEKNDKRTNENNTDEQLDKLKKLVKEGKSTPTGINIEGFIQVMKDGKHDF